MKNWLLRKVYDFAFGIAILALVSLALYGNIVKHALILQKIKVLLFECSHNFCHIEALTISYRTSSNIYSPPNTSLFEI